MALSNSKARKKIVLPPTFIFTSYDQSPVPAFGELKGVESACFAPSSPSVSQPPLVGSLAPTPRQLPRRATITSVQAYYVGSMPSKTDGFAARRTVAELSRATGGRLKQMRSLQQIVDHAGADAEAVYHAVKRFMGSRSRRRMTASIELDRGGREARRSDPRRHHRGPLRP